MRYLSRTQYQQLIDGADLLRQDLHGPKVYQLSDGRIVKLFRVKRWWSSSMLYPYSWRFRRNSRRLQRRGVACVTVDEIFYCRAIRRHGVVYQRLEGEPLDRLLPTSGSAADAVFVAYARFFASLHARRVLFRSPHPGNVLRLPDGDFGLIDIGDLRFPKTAMSLDQRHRNFRHLLRSIEFKDALSHHPGSAFIDAYLDASGLPIKARETLAARLREDFGPDTTA